MEWLSLHVQAVSVMGLSWDVKHGQPQEDRLPVILATHPDR